MQEPSTITTELCFLQVPLPESSHVVARLQESSSVTMAAAVYSGVDVVAILTDTQEQIDIANAGIDAEIELVDSPIEKKKRESLPVDKIVHGLSFGSCQPYLRSACTAFIRCVIRRPEVGVAEATSELARLPGVARLFPISTHDEVILEAVAVDKRALDETVMSTIQGHWNVAKYTRTFIVIDHLRWERDPTFPEPSLLVNTADVDLPLGMALADRVENDTGIRCRTYPSFPIDARFPVLSLDDAITAARCHIFVVSKAGLDSVACQSRFKKVEARAEPHDICCLVLPDCTSTDLRGRYEQIEKRFDASSFLAYPALLDWMRSRL